MPSLANRPQHPFNLQTCARPNILKLQPYQCARDNHDAADNVILLDANENPHGSTVLGHPSLPTNQNIPNLHLYPDPRNVALKSLFCQLRSTGLHEPIPLTPANMFLGLGSDEAVDALMRAFCRPGQDKILITTPTYGMYAVSAQVNDLEVVDIPLDVRNNFALRTDAINSQLSADPNIKIVYLCSPGNPTGTLIPRHAIEAVLRHPTWNGLVVVDEAYIDFAPRDASMAEFVNAWPNLVVLQTMSKSFGLAGIRLGACFASTEVAFLLNKLRAPYNISQPTAHLAMVALGQQGLATMSRFRSMIETQRNRMLKALPRIPGVGRQVGGLHANFIMFEILESSHPGARASNKIAAALYERLAEDAKIVIRYRGNERGCKGCVRISVGTEEQTTKLLNDMTHVLAELYRSESAEQQQLQQQRVVEEASNRVEIQQAATGAVAA